MKKRDDWLTRTLIVAAVAPIGYALGVYLDKGWEVLRARWNRCPILVETMDGPARCRLARGHGSRHQGHPLEGAL